MFFFIGKAVWLKNKSHGSVFLIYYIWIMEIGSFEGICILQGSTLDKNLVTGSWRSTKYCFEVVLGPYVFTLLNWNACRWMEYDRVCGEERISKTCLLQWDQSVCSNYSIKLGSTFNPIENAYAITPNFTKVQIIIINIIIILGLL